MYSIGQKFKDKDTGQEFMLCAVASYRCNLICIKSGSFAGHAPMQFENREAIPQSTVNSLMNGEWDLEPVN